MQTPSVGTIFSRQLITGNGKRPVKVFGEFRAKAEPEQPSPETKSNIAYYYSPEIRLPVSLKDENQNSSFADILARPIKLLDNLFNFTDKLFANIAQTQNLSEPLDSFRLSSKLSLILKHELPEGLELARQAGVFNEKSFVICAQMSRLSQDPESRLYKRGDFLVQLLPGGGDYLLEPCSSLFAYGLEQAAYRQAVKLSGVEYSERFSLPENEYQKLLQQTTKIQIEDQVNKQSQELLEGKRPSILENDLLRSFGSTALPIFDDAHARSHPNDENHPYDNWIQLAFAHSTDSINTSGEFALRDAISEEEKNRILREDTFEQLENQFLVSAAGPIINLPISPEVLQDVRYEAMLTSHEIQSHTFPDFNPQV